MKTLPLIALCMALIAPTAFASDSWSSCSNSDGGVKVEYDTLMINGDEIAGPKVLKKTILEKKKEYCRLAGSGSKVIAMINEVSLEKIQFNYMGTLHTAYVVCERGGSGIPANDNCRD